MKQVITIKCEIPDTNYQIKIQEVHEVGGQLIVISDLSTKPARFTSATTIEAKDSTLVQTHSETELPIKHYVFNNTRLIKPTWTFNSKDSMPTIKNRSEIKEKLSAATRLEPLPSSPLFDKKPDITPSKPKDDSSKKIDGTEKMDRSSMGPK